MAGGWNRGQSSALAKLTLGEVLLVRQAHAEGKSISFISRTMKVHRKTIQNIVHKRSYLWVDRVVEMRDAQSSEGGGEA
jgi:plasmid maintenance system antidote protein VapI